MGPQDAVSGVGFFEFSRAVRSGPAPAAHAAAQASAQVSRIGGGRSSVTLSSTCQLVGIEAEATGPKTSCRSVSDRIPDMLVAHQQSRPQNQLAPGRGRGSAGLYRRPEAVLRGRPPGRCVQRSSRSILTPACDTIPCPAAETFVRPVHGIGFTLRVPSRLGWFGLW